jgi:hypothetical protein
LPVFNAVMTAAIAAQTAPANIGAGFWNSEPTSAAYIAGDIVSVSRWWSANCIGCARILSARAVLPTASEAFLSEHR